MSHPFNSDSFRRLKKPNLDLSMKSIIDYLVSKQLRPVLVNWKTTLAGVALLLAESGKIVAAFSAVANGDGLDLESLGTLTVNVPIAVGLILGRDANVSSQESGVR
jgi:hypothetical protein